MAAFGAFAPLRLTAMLLLAITACSNGEPDAYGNFEATEVTVAAEVGGRLLAFRLEEGDRVNGDSVLGVVDTVPLVLEREAVIARRAAAQARTREAAANISALEVQRTIADRELARTERLTQAGGRHRAAGRPRRAGCAGGAGAARRRQGGQGQRAAGGRGARRPDRLARRPPVPEPDREARSPARC